MFRKSAKIVPITDAEARKIELEESNPAEALKPLQTMNKRLNLLSRESEPSIWVQMFTGIAAAECPGTYIPSAFADKQTVDDVNALLGSKFDNDNASVQQLQLAVSTEIDRLEKLEKHKKTIARF